MATLAPPSATTGEHRKKELQKGCAVALVLLTFNTGLTICRLRDDLESVASIGVTYVGLVLVFGRRFGCWEPRTNGGRWWLDTATWFLFLLVAFLLVSRFARTVPSSASLSVLMPVAAAGAAALGVGGVCAYLLHRRSWWKQQRRELILLPLRQDSRSGLDISIDPLE